MLNILGKRYLFFALSLVIILPGWIVLAISGLPLAIDFVGGSMLDIKFSSGSAPEPAEIIKALGSLGITEVQVRTTGMDELIIRTPVLEGDLRTQVINSIEEATKETVIVQRFETVGPTIGKEVTERAALAIVVASLGVILYIWFAFRGVQNAWRYGLCAIFATIHDVLIIVSIASLGSRFLGWQIDSLFLTAFLTVIGFSTQDTIVVFDRIRENSSIFRKLQFEKLVNHSIVQTLQRSINTQLMTSNFLLLSLALMGGVTLREFALVLFIGMMSGTYSSIFIAAPVLVVWENKEWRWWFNPKAKPSAA